MGIEIVFNWIVDFFDQQFINLILATMLLFLVMFITWWVYKKLSTRNIFSLFGKKTSEKDLTAKDYWIYGLKYFLLFPVITFIGFLIFALSLFLLIKPTDVIVKSNILFIAIIIVCTIRASAYVSEAMAEDLAKLVPLSLFGVLLTHPAAAATGVTAENFLTFLFLIPSILKYLLFIVILELILRGGTWLIGNIHKE